MNILKLNKANNKLVVSELNRSPNHSGDSGPLTQASPASKKG